MDSINIIQQIESTLLVSQMKNKKDKWLIKYSVDLQSTTG